MGQIKKAWMAHTQDDMGKVPPELNGMIEKAQREYELSKYSTQELQAELERRGYVHGVLIHPEKDI